MLNILEKIFLNKSAINFEDQYIKARIIVGEYLAIWFEEIFTTEKFALVFKDDPDIYNVLATQVSNYLFGEELKENNPQLSKKVQQQIKEVLPYVPKWANDAMKQDSNLKEFVVQTLRMEMIFDQIKEGVEEWSEKDKSKRIMALFKIYGQSIPNSPNLSSYNKLLNKWSNWLNTQEK